MMKILPMGQGYGNLCRTKGASVELAFRVIGNGPPIVLLHGTSANHAVWMPITEALANKATVISVDQRGHGQSDKPEDGYDGAAFSDDVITILDTLELERAVVAGHSLGARNAWVAAARYPDRIAAVVAIDYVPFVEMSVLDTLQTRVASGDRVFSDMLEIEAYLQERYPRMPKDAVSRRARWGYQIQNSNGWVPLATPKALRQVVDGLRTPWEREFRESKIPMTCLRGNDSAIVSPEAWEKAREVRPDARWKVIDNADHYVPEEKPYTVAQELSAMLSIM